ncbi:MAG: ABC transporter permease [Actinomycetia bacterium]|nr:ABC transporter permease [Actinomycetes bacterium]
MTSRSAFGGGVGLRAWWRDLVSERAVLLSVAMAIALAAMVASAIPRALERASIADLDEALQEASPEQRNIVFERETRLGPAGPADPFKLVKRHGELLLEDTIPGPVQQMIVERRFVYESPRFSAVSYPGLVAGPFPTTFNFRMYQGIEERLRLVRGAEPSPTERIPMATGSGCPHELVPSDPPDPMPDDCAVVFVSVFGILLTEQTATDMRLDVGSEMLLTPALLGDLAWRSAQSDVSEVRAIARVTGIIELTDPSDPYWFADDSLHRPRVTENPDYRLVFAAGLFRPDDYRSLVRLLAGVDSHYDFRYLVDLEQVARADALDLAGQIDKIDHEGARVVTGLPAILRDHVEQRETTIRVLSIAVTSLVVVTVGVVLMLASVSASRRRCELALLADRGASPRHLLASAVATAATVAIPAGAIGWTTARLMVPGTGSRNPTMLVSALVVGAIVVFGVGGSARRPIASGARAARRVTSEVILVVLAVGGLVSVRRRGALDTGRTELDWLVALVPVLLLGAVSLVAVRGVRTASKWSAHAAARSRGVVWFIGLRRLHRGLGDTVAPFVIATLAMGAATIAIIEMQSLDQRRLDSSWSTVGADFRVESGHPDIPLTPPLVEDLASKWDVVRGRTVAAVRMRGPSGVVVVDLVVLEAATYAGMVTASGAVHPRRDALERIAGEVPQAVESIAVGLSHREISEGDVVTTVLGGSTLDLVVAEMVDHFPGVETGSSLMVVDFDAFRSIASGRLTQPTWVLLSGERTDVGELESRIEESGPGELRSRYTMLDELRGDPLSRWTDRGLVAVGLLSVAFTLVVVAASVAAVRPSRGYEMDLLAILGSTRRELRRIAMLEHVLLAGTAATIGVCAGTGTTWLLESSLGLDTVGGEAADLGLSVRVTALVAIVGLVIAVAVASIQISPLLQGASMSSILRRGGERDV